MEPTDPDYFVDHIEDYVDATSYSYSYNYTSGGKVHTYEYSSTYYSQYFYFEETGEFIYVYQNKYEYIYDGVASSYDYEYSFDYSEMYGEDYYDTYIKTNTYYQSYMFTVDSDLLRKIEDELNKLKPVV